MIGRLGRRTEDSALAARGVSTRGVTRCPNATCGVRSRRMGPIRAALSAGPAATAPVAPALRATPSTTAPRRQSAGSGLPQRDDKQHHEQRQDDGTHLHPHVAGRSRQRADQSEPANAAGLGPLRNGRPDGRSGRPRAGSPTAPQPVGTKPT
jgi:hypothetical protein